MSEYPDLDELVWLFEADAQFEHGDIGWPVEGVTFKTERGDWHVECAIGIYDYSFGVVASHNGKRVFDLHLHQVVDRITIDKRDEIQALVVWPVPRHDLREVRLQMRPHIQLDVASINHWDRR